MATAFVLELQRRYPAWGDIRDVQRIVGGLSGANVFRMRCDGGGFAVKLSPGGASRLALARARHAVIEGIAASSSGPLFPPLEPDRDGQTAWLADIGRESIVGAASGWMDSDFDPHGETGPPSAVSAFELTARFHSAAGALPLAADVRELLASPASFPERYLTEWRRIDDVSLVAARQALSSLSGEPRELAENYLARLPNMAAETRRAFDELPPPDRPPQLCLRDVHRKDIVYRGGRAVAFLDWDAMRFDRRIADFARLAVSCGLGAENAAAIVDEAVRADGAGLPLSAWERKALAPAMATQRWIPPLNWLIWIFVERRDFADRAVAEERLLQTLRLVTEDGSAARGSLLGRENN